MIGDMKKYDSFKTFGVVVALAAASLSMTSCDDGPHDPWHDQYGWYDNYNHGDWGWNQDDWNNGQEGDQGSSASSTLLEEAQTLVGTWQGTAQLSELADDGQSRNNYEFDTKMTFYQTGSSNSLSGSGYEIDTATDGSGDKQTLEFSWYIDNNGDIYIKYASGTTYVMDAGASQFGFHLGYEKGSTYDTFYGYMIGTGKAKGDIMYINLTRVSTANSRAAASADSVDENTSSFGGANGRTEGIANTVKKLPKR